MSNKTAQQILPYQEFTKEDMGNRDTIRNYSKNSETIAKISLDNLFIRDNFNFRTEEEYGDLEALAEQILSFGQLQPGRVDVLNDGKFVIVDGHRRYRALLILENRGYDDICFLAIVNKVATTEDDRIFQMFITQDNEKLNPVSIARLIRQLVNLNHPQTEIAKKIGKPDSYVSNMLSFEKESPIIKQHVLDGKIAVNTVLQAQRDIPSQTERTKKINEAVEEKATQTDNTKSGKRVTIEEISGPVQKEFKKSKVYKSYPDNKPSEDALCLVKTPEWNEEGYYVSTFRDGLFNDTVNGTLDGLVTEWVELDESGLFKI